MIQTKENPVPKKRPRRSLIDAEQRNRLTVSNLDEANFVYRWVNDTRSRIQDLLERGYEFVNSQGKTVGDATIDSARSDSSILSQRMGGGVTSYLMAIPKEFFQEDQTYKAKKIDELEATIFEAAKNKGNYGSVDVNQRNRK